MNQNHQNRKGSIIIEISDLLRRPINSFFENPELPIEVDLGCGKGSFLISHASKNNEINYLGIEKLTSRLAKVERKCLRHELRNVALLNAEASLVIGGLLPADSINAYYIFFPDPWPKRKHHERRLFSELFIDSLYNTLKAKGLVHIATDDKKYIEDIEKLFKANPNFKQTSPFIPNEDERTDFEKIFSLKGISANRLSYFKI